MNSKISKFRTLFCATMLLSMAVSSVYADGSEPSSPRAQQAGQQQNEQTPPSAIPSLPRYFGYFQSLISLGYFGTEAVRCTLPFVLDYVFSYNDILRSAGLRPLPFMMNRMLQGLAKKMKVTAVGGLVDNHPNASEAGAVRVGNRGIISIAENAFNLLSRDKQQFVLAHELAHIRHDDVHMKQRLSAAYICLYGLLLCTQRYRQKRDGKLLRYPIIPMMVHLLARCALDRKQEYAADTAALRSLNSASGAVRYFRGLKTPNYSLPGMRLMDCGIGGVIGESVVSYALPEDSNLTERQRKVINVLSWVAGGFVGYKLGICSRYLVPLLATHPTPQQRIRALEKLNLS